MRTHTRAHVERKRTCSALATPTHKPPLPPAAWLAAWLQVQFNNPAYSRGIRQRVAKAAEEGGWLHKYRMAVGE